MVVALEDAVSCAGGDVFCVVGPGHGVFCCGCGRAPWFLGWGVRCALAYHVFGHLCQVGWCLLFLALFYEFVVAYSVSVVVGDCFVDGVEVY